MCRLLVHLHECGHIVPQNEHCPLAGTRGHDAFEVQALWNDDPCPLCTESPSHFVNAMWSTQLTVQEVAASLNITIDHPDLLNIIAEFYARQHFQATQLVEHGNSTVFSPQSAVKGDFQQDEQLAHALQDLQQLEDERMPDFTDSALPSEKDFDELFRDWINSDPPELSELNAEVAPDQAGPATNEGELLPFPGLFDVLAGGQHEDIPAFVDPVTLEHFPSTEAEGAPFIAGNTQTVHGPAADTATVNLQAQQLQPSITVEHQEAPAPEQQQLPKGKTPRKRAGATLNKTETKRAAPSKTPRRKPAAKETAPQTPTARAGTKRTASNTEKKVSHAEETPEETPPENTEVQNALRNIIRCSEEIRSNSRLLARVDAFAGRQQAPRIPSGGQRAQVPKREVADRREELSVLREECERLADDCERVASDAERITIIAQEAARHATPRFKRSPTPYPRDFSPVPEAKAQALGTETQWQHWTPLTPFYTAAKKPEHDKRNKGEEKPAESELESESPSESKSAVMAMSGVIIPKESERQAQQAQQHAQQQPADNNNKEGGSAARPRRSGRIRKPSLRALGL